MKTLTQTFEEIYNNFIEYEGIRTDNLISKLINAVKARDEEVLGEEETIMRGWFGLTQQQAYEDAKNEVDLVNAKRKEIKQKMEETL